MRCVRCDVRMLPSQSVCDVCRPFLDDDLAIIRQERGGEMARNKMFGVAAYLVAVVAIGGGVLVTWVLLFVGIAAAAAGTKALERARLYSHFPSYDDLRARRIAERQAQRSLLRGAD